MGSTDQADRNHHADRLDDRSAAALADAGLAYRRVDPDGDAFAPFIKAVSRGFLDAEPTDEQVAALRERVAGRLLTGVYDAAAVDATSPVATIDSWHTELTLPYGRSVAMWAISGVTVSPTHRRRGIARAMLEGELRSAAEAGYAVAGLTVSEATIYSRFGFAPAVFASDWTIDTRRARWIGPVSDGRLHAVDRERLADELSALHERTRLQQPGNIAGWPGAWRRMAGIESGNEQRGVRGVVYTDAGGTVRGVMGFTITENRDDFSRGELAISMLIAEDDAAYRALWRFALEHDLIAVVRAPLRSIDEPLRWMIADQRAAQVTVGEHGWLRVLDVPTLVLGR